LIPLLLIYFLKGFLEFSGYEIDTKKQNDNFRALFELLSKDINTAHSLLDEYIKSVNQKQIASIDIPKLVSELYKLKNFDWGGDYQNSLIRVETGFI
jgi:hypothetical protein